MNSYDLPFNANSMREIVKTHSSPRPKGFSNLRDGIEARIRLNAKMGRNSASFLNNEYISYLKEHQHEYESLGFIIVFDNDHGYIEATVYWEE